MKHTNILCTLFAAIVAATSAAQSLPPVFGNTPCRADELRQAYIAPTRIVWTSGDTLVSDAGVLLRLTDGQPEMNRARTCAMRSTPADTASIILDYGKEVHGGLKLVLGSSNVRGGSPVRIRFGESVEETCSELLGTAGGKKCSTNDHAIRDLTLTIPREGKIELGHTGFRFVRIDLLQAAEIHIKEASAVLRYRDLPYAGSFQCSDTLLNRIWMTGAYTVQLNMQEYLWDGIKRDRQIWLGDMHPEVATIGAVFGSNEIVPRSIDWACRQFPLPKWLNGIASYSMWYLIIQYEWYMQGADKAYLQQHHDYIAGVVDQIDGGVAEDGSENLAKWRFLDWPSSPNKAGVENGYRALLCWAMHDAEKLCHILGDDAHASKCRDIVRRIEKRPFDPHGLKQAAALMTIAGVPGSEASPALIRAGGAKGFSTFFGYYMLEALARDGAYQDALDIIRRFWGGMLDLGATTFWEDFNLDWTENAGRIDAFTPQGKKDIHGDFGAYCYPSYRHSLCHGWASGPTPWLSRHVLGIEIVEPGCRKLRVVPHLGDLQWAEGSYPTPLGTLYVSHRKQPDGSVRSDIRAPKGITILRR